jgi:hypothetical protein
MSISFKELTGSPVETYDSDGMKAVRQLICAWDDRNSFVAEILGSGYQSGTLSAIAYPDASSVLAAKVEVEPLTDDMAKQELTSLTGGLNSYNGFAKVTVTYETETTTTSTTTNNVTTGSSTSTLTYVKDVVYETINVPAASLAWPGNSDATFPTDAQGNVRVPVTVHKLQWTSVTSPPWTAIRKCSGTLNTEEFLGASAGTLIFDGAEASAEFETVTNLSTAVSGWTLKYTFRESPLLFASSENVFTTSDFSALIEF